MTSGVRMTGDMGRINYVSWCMAVGRRDLRATMRDWDELPEAEQKAWRVAAETVIDEHWVATGGTSEVRHHHV